MGPVVPPAEERDYDIPAAKAWDQRETLRPAPFTGPLAKLLDGLDEADPLYDVLPEETLLGAVHGTSNLPDSPDPEWVDWEVVARGQKLWNTKHLSPAVLALGGALLQGFSIARFSEVLEGTGYNVNPHTTFERFQMTAFHVTDWYFYPLNDPSSRSRVSIRTVRAMHAMARKKALERKVFDPAKGEGVPLSQYDMGEVLMAFGVIAMHMMEEIIGTSIPRDERKDMMHVMRVVGHYLGIQDKYNTCSDLEEADRMFTEYMGYTAQRFRTTRESGHSLQTKTREGLGAALPFGMQFWDGYTANLTSIAMKGDISVFRVAPLPGVQSYAKFIVSLFKYPLIIRLVNKAVFDIREMHRTDMKTVRRIRKVNATLARVSDNFTWPLLSKFYLLGVGVRKYIRPILVIVVLLAYRAFVNRPRLAA
eukprot:Hpha_TRINITY_DN13685_c0_g1::TRINITY_DN13685_c0_g1_i2::g.122500::m.122500